MNTKNASGHEANISNENSQEVSMGLSALQKLFASDPAAKSEHDALIVKATEEGHAAGTKEGHEAGTKEGHEAGAKEATESHKATIDKVVPVISSASYAQPMKDLAVKVLKGEEKADTLTAAVASVDASIEQDASAKAKAEQKGQGETHTDDAQSASTDGTISSEEDLAAAAARAAGDEEVSA
jgi:hypothetical protein